MSDEEAHDEEKTLLDRVKAHRIIVGLLLVAAVMTALQVIAGTISSGIESARNRIDWRRPVYESLQSLAAGFSVEKFDEVLGAPVFVRRHERWTERSYQGRDHWVQAVVNSEGVVDFYAVTSCEDSFRPSFTLPYSGREVRLRRDTLETGMVDEPSSAYFVPGATASFSLFDHTYQGNPGNYKTYVWGLNGTCLGDFFDSKMEEELILPFGPEGAIHTYYSNEGPPPEGVVEMRRRARINTYAETSVSVELTDLPLRINDFDEGEGFEIGVDRILIRTVPGESQF